MTSTRTATGSWNFDGFGPEFDQHVAAHLPGYMDVQQLIALVASFRLPEQGVLADYGASTGRTAQMIAERTQRSFTAHLYDADPSMLDQAAARFTDPHPVTLRLHPGQLPGDGVRHSGADLSLALWFLQFLHPSTREAVLRQIRSGSADHGALLVATKTQHPDSRWEEIAVAALDDYKEEQGVTPTERAAKTRSLRGTMFPADAEELIELIAVTGWTRPTILWRWHVWTVLGSFAV